MLWQVTSLHEYLVTSEVKIMLALSRWIVVKIKYEYR